MRKYVGLQQHCRNYLTVVVSTQVVLGLHRYANSLQGFTFMRTYGLLLNCVDY